MDWPATSLPPQAVPVRAADICQIVAVHEDLVAHGRAVELADRLSTQFKGEPVFGFSSWSFKDLAEPLFFRTALDAGAIADVILLSVHGNELPPAVRLWLDLCSGHRTKTEGSLVFLLAEPFMLSASSGAAIGTLQRAARLLRMDFLPLIPQPAEQIIRRFQERAGSADAAFDDIQIQNRPSFDHWGLNE